MGTTGYIAPECLHDGAPASPSSDLYALGATLYKLRHGFLPGGALASGGTVDFDARRAEVVTRSTGVGARAASSAAPSTLEGPLGELLAQLLSPDPRTRPRHAEWVDPGAGAAAGARSFAGHEEAGARAVAQGSAAASQAAPRGSWRPLRGGPSRGPGAARARAAARGA